MNVGFEEILTTIGDWGFYQKKLLYLILIPYSFLLPWSHSSTIFMLSAPKHVCKVPELENYSIDLQIFITDPSTVAMHDQNKKKTSICEMLDINYADYLRDLRIPENETDLETAKIRIKDYFKQNDMPGYKKCDDWLFDKADYDETAITKFGLVCDKEYMANNVLSASGLGSIIGTMGFGAMSDKAGRKKTILVVNVLFLISCFSPSLINNYYCFLLSRFLMCSVINTVYQIPFVLLTELVGPEKRTMLGFWSAMAWSIGIVILPGYAYLLRNWVYMNHVIVATGIYYAISYFWFLESPRWLLSKDRIEEAEKVLKQIALKNKVPDAEKTIFVQKLNMVGRKESVLTGTSANSTKNKDSTLVLLTNRTMLKIFLNITLAYVADSMAYNAINQNTFTLEGSQFMNYFVLSVIEVPASVVGYYAMESRLGRRWTASAFVLVYSVLQLFAVFISSTTAKIIFSSIGKLLLTISFGAIYQISVEIYPTAVRNQGLAWSATISAVQSIILPHFISRNQDGDNFWVLIFITTVSFISGFLLTFLPETLNEKLPQTIFDAEVFGLDRKFWSLAKRKSKDKDDGQPENGDLKDLNNNCNDETGRNWSAHCYSNNVETEK